MLDVIIDLKSRYRSRGGMNRRNVTKHRPNAMYTESKWGDLRVLSLFVEIPPGTQILMAILEHGSLEFAADMRC